MASAGGAAPAATTGSSGPEQARPRGEGRGGARGGQQNRQRNRGGQNQRGSGRGGRGGRGRGQGNPPVPANPAAQDVAAAAAASHAQAILKLSQAATGDADGTASETDVCFICANPVAHTSIAPCNHTTCHICGLRMRALYKTKDCAHCRTPAPFVIFTDDTEKRFEDYTDADTTTTDTNIGIKYTNEDIVGDTVLLLRYNCPDPSCDFAGLGWPDLHRHVKSAHRKRMCDLCTRNKRVFTHEHELFTDRELERHMRHGDDQPGAADQTGFKGHPLCGFCGERFYDDDKLYEHCRMKHERCFICDRRDSRRPHYYQDYNALEEHFRKDHYLCGDRECMEKKFVVFESELDLQAHRLSEHGGKTIGRDARLVDMSGFDIRQSYDRRDGDGNRGGRGGRNRGGRQARGRDPNAEDAMPLPPTQQALRRDEIAFQRQMAIHSAQSISNRTFGGQLTPSSASAAHTPRNGTGSNTPSAPSPRPTSQNGPSRAPGDSTSPIDNLTISDTSAMTPAERARVVRHSSVIERAANLLSNDTSKLTTFRTLISSYQSSSLSAPQLTDAFFTLFSDTSSNALGTLVREVADLFESKAKADALRQAWQDWRAINEDYPSLPGLSGMQGETTGSSGWANAANANPAVPNAAAVQKHSNRVLRLKNSTRLGGPAPVSGSSAVVGSSGWTSRPAVRPPPSSAFPSLPSSSTQPQSSSSTSTWKAPSSTTTPVSNTQPPPPLNRRKAPGPGGDAFPALPAAPKPTTTIFGYGGTGRGVRRDFGQTQSNFSWGSSAAESAATGAAGAANDDGEGEQVGGKGKKGGKKGKKQVLVQWG